LLWIYYDQLSLADLGLTRGDEVFPRFIIEGMPPGVSGLVLAGVLAAAMSTLSSSLNSLASSSILDLYQRFVKKQHSETSLLRASKWITVFWGLVFMGFASLFQNQQNPVVELGLAIASFTYGGLLGAFLLGILIPSAHQKDALIAFAATIVIMVWVIFGIWYSTELDTWIFTFYPSEGSKSSLGLRGIGWPWYTTIGTSISLIIGYLRTLGRPSTP
jgi:Na+/proline symporter